MQPPPFEQDHPVTRSEIIVALASVQATYLPTPPGDIGVLIHRLNTLGLEPGGPAFPPPASATNLPNHLTHAQLAAIIASLREAMYFDDDGQVDIDRSVNGGDLVELVGNLMEQYNLVPPSPTRTRAVILLVTVPDKITDSAIADVIEPAVRAALATIDGTLDEHEITNEPGTDADHA